MCMHIENLTLNVIIVPIALDCMFACVFVIACMYILPVMYLLFLSKQ